MEEKNKKTSKVSWFFFSIFILSGLIFLILKKNSYLEIWRINHDVLFLLLPTLLFSIAAIFISKDKNLTIASISIIIFIFFLFVDKLDENNIKMESYKFINEYNCSLSARYGSGINTGETPSSFFDQTFYKENFSFITLKLKSLHEEDFFILINNIDMANLYINVLENADKFGLSGLNADETKKWLKETADSISKTVCILPR
jgi:hypothetical protein